MKFSLRHLALFALALPLPIFAAQASESSESSDPYADSYYSCDRITITQYTPAGAFVHSGYVPDDNPDTQSRGIAFGPEGLYVVRSNPFLPSTVQVLDASETVIKTYTFKGKTSGATSGNLRFSPSGKNFYVAGQHGIYRFKTGGTDGKQLIQQGSTDLEVMPNGDLLVANGYELRHHSADGTLLGTVRDLVDPHHVGGPDRLVDARGVAYDARTDTTFVTTLGYSNFEFRLLALEGMSNVLKGITSFGYGSSMVVTPEGTLLVGSLSQPPAIFSFSDTTPMTLTLIGNLQTASAPFVTTVPARRPR